MCGLLVEFQTFPKSLKTRYKENNPEAGFVICKIRLFRNNGIFDNIPFENIFFGDDTT